MTHGGKRPGSGRPKLWGDYDEPTRPIRVPTSMVVQVKNFVINKGYRLPLFACSVEAGFPSPADDYIEDKLDLNEHLIKHPTATFIVKASGLSMINAGINPGDLLIVDRSLEARHGKIVIAAIDGELTVKRLDITSKGTFLVPENDEFSPIKIAEGSDVVIWGVVTTVLHDV